MNQVKQTQSLADKMRSISNQAIENKRKNIKPIIDDLMKKVENAANTGVFSVGGTCEKDAYPYVREYFENNGFVFELISSKSLAEFSISWGNSLDTIFSERSFPLNDYIFEIMNYNR